MPPPSEFPLLSRRLEIEPRSVYVAFADPRQTELNSTDAAYEALLSDEELVRLRRFYFERDRQLFRVAHALVRTTLARLTGRPPATLLFETGPHGKPRLLAENGSPSELHFNLSHTHGMVMLGVAPSIELGVDVEKVRLERATIDIARRFFATSEVEALAASHPERFFDFWALKEAYIKARGAGLSLPLGQFAYAIDGDRLGLAVDEDLGNDGDRWQVTLLGPTPEHRAAVAAARDDGPALNFTLFDVVPGLSELPYRGARLASTLAART